MLAINVRGNAWIRLVLYTTLTLNFITYANYFYVSSDLDNYLHIIYTSVLDRIKERVGCGTDRCVLIY